MYCKNCGLQLTDGSHFCARCGAPAGEGARYCAGCGREVQEGQRFCMFCGAQLAAPEAAPVAEAAPVTDEVPGTEAPAPETPAEEVVNDPFKKFEQYTAETPRQEPFGQQEQPQPSAYEQYRQQQAGNAGQAGYGQGYRAEPQPVPVAQPKSRLVAGLLGIFLGCFGVHRFYLGYVGLGLTQLLCSVLTCCLLSPFIWVWGLVEGILILCKAGILTDAKGNPLSD